MPVLHVFTLPFLTEVGPQACSPGQRCKVQLQEVHGPTGRWPRRDTRVTGFLKPPLRRHRLRGPQSCLQASEGPSRGGGTELALWPQGVKLGPSRAKSLQGDSKKNTYGSVSRGYEGRSAWERARLQAREPGERQAQSGSAQTSPAKISKDYRETRDKYGRGGAGGR